MKWGLFFNQGILVSNHVLGDEKRTSLITGLPALRSVNTNVSQTQFARRTGLLNYLYEIDTREWTINK